MRPKPLRRLLPRAPRELEGVIDWCFAANPADRPSSMAILLPILNDLIRASPRM
jgi:hypothetical protein